ncbi:hypothetical protein SNE40_004759 [Patella caerulea]|uniref:Uncharacterized protein n=1 Tax=Patella caerulea TaxID=87958 RepID=A0AAN8Q5X4_PATCE
MTAIPKSWKKKVAERSEPKMIGPIKPSILETLTKAKKGCSIFLKLFESKIEYNKKKKVKWKMDIGQEINDETWKKIFMIPWKCTAETKFIEFQYKMVNRILTTQTVLFKIKIKENNLCSFCEQVPETLEFVLLLSYLTKTVDGFKRVVTNIAR